MKKRKFLLIITLLLIIAITIPLIIFNRKNESKSEKRVDNKEYKYNNVLSLRSGEFTFDFFADDKAEKIGGSNDSIDFLSRKPMYYNISNSTNTFRFDTAFSLNKYNTSVISDISSMDSDCKSGTVEILRFQPVSNISVPLSQGRLSILSDNNRFLVLPEDKTIYLNKDTVLSGLKTENIKLSTINDIFVNGINLFYSYSNIYEYTCVAKVNAVKHASYQGPVVVDETLRYYSDRVHVGVNRLIPENITLQCSDFSTNFDPVKIMNPDNLRQLDISLDENRLYKNCGLYVGNSNEYNVTFDRDMLDYDYQEINDSIKMIVTNKNPVFASSTVKYDINIYKGAPTSVLTLDFGNKVSEITGKYGDQTILPRPDGSEFSVSYTDWQGKTSVNTYNFPFSNWSVVSMPDGSITSGGLQYIYGKSDTYLRANYFDYVMVNLKENSNKKGHTCKWYQGGTVVNSPYNPPQVTLRGDTAFNEVCLPNTYTVNFNYSNVNPSNSNNLPQSINATYGEAIGTLPIPKNSNWNFEGWVTSDGRAITKDTIYTFDSNITLVAKWSSKVEVPETPRSYVISFDYNDVDISNLSNLPRNKEVTYGQKIGDLPVPISSSSYYTFSKWVTASGEVVDKNTIYNFNSNITIFALWNVSGAPIIDPQPTSKSYTITFDYGVVSPANLSVLPRSKLVTYGEKVGDLPVPTANNYVFNSWITSSGTIIDKNTIYSFDSNITITAVWDMSGVPVVTPEPDNPSLSFSIVGDNVIISSVISTQVSKVKGNFEYLGNVRITDSAGNTRSNDSLLATGFKIIGSSGQYEVVIPGDISGDGRIDSRDMLSLRRSLLETVKLSGSYKKASDINEDGRYDSRDLKALREILRNNN